MKFLDSLAERIDSLIGLNRVMLVTAVAGFVFDTVLWLYLRDMPVLLPTIGSFPDLFFSINSFFLIIMGLQAERSPNLRKLLVIGGAMLGVATSLYILLVFHLFFTYRFTIFRMTAAFYNLNILLLILFVYTIKSSCVKK
ncbi:hypothetical protein J5834_01020 [bacterium]|nr:hypothetical protein [bacterium]